MATPLSCFHRSNFSYLCVRGETYVTILSLLQHPQWKRKIHFHLRPKCFFDMHHEHTMTPPCWIHPFTFICTRKQATDIWHPKMSVFNQKNITLTIFIIISNLSHQVLQARLCPCASARLQHGPERGLQELDHRPAVRRRPRGQQSGLHLQPLRQTLGRKHFHQDSFTTEKQPTQCFIDCGLWRDVFNGACGC